MTEYDNTNRGIVGQPYENQRLVASGKLNIEGDETRYVVIREQISRDGRTELVLYERAGVLFANEDKANEKAPDYSGPLDRRPGKRVAAWRGEKDGRHYMSLTVSDKQQRNGGGGQSDDPFGPQSDFDDEIPF